MQLDIFSNSIAPIPEVSHGKSKHVALISPAPVWSFSKLETIKQCPRKYYYQYFGSKKSKAKSDVNKEELNFLSTLQNKYFLIGDIVHSIIKTYLTKAKKGESWSKDKVINWGKKRINDSVYYSERFQRKYIKPQSSIYTPALLNEIIFKKENGEKILKDGNEKVEKCLDNFLNSDVFESLKIDGSNNSSMIEKLAKFSFGDDVKASGKIDLVINENGKTVIADWKTGKVDNQETSLQLLSYAWWAIKEEKCESQDILIKKAYLLENELYEMEFSDMHLERAKARIINDSQLLKQYESFGLDGDMDVFSKITHEKVCEMCPFQSVCLKID